MSIKLSKGNLFVKGERSDLIPMDVFTSGSDKSVKELKEYTDNLTSAAKTDITEKAEEQLARIPEVTQLIKDVQNAENATAEATAKADSAISIAKGRATGYVFDTEADMRTWVNSHKSELVLGDNLYIRATEVPDYWWDGANPQKLETQKVDLSNYLQKTDYIEMTLEEYIVATKDPNKYYVVVE